MIFDDDGMTDWDYGYICILQAMILSDTTLHMSIYNRDRAYGGPEEGGWYYDIAEPLRKIDFPDIAKKIIENMEDPECPYVIHGHFLSIRFELSYLGVHCKAKDRVYDSSGRLYPERLGFNIRQAHKMMQEFVDTENRSRYPTSSVLSDGMYEVRLELHEPRLDPPTRPRYE